FDLVINGTSASLQGEVPPLPDGILAEGAGCYDMMYGAEPTAFMAWASEHRAAYSVDGLGMLVEQAAESFLLWRGVRPETSPVIQALREALDDYL
ncbi:MAG: shikimate dehydrogenase, partial [Gammaproteobacteria bacterium]|nr:shikimate dehydrogenase [Gammaproteobacteria bacterium]